MSDVATVAPSVPSMFATLSATADLAAGASLEKEKTNLVGVPFVVTSATVREGIRRPGTDEYGNFWSLEITVADLPTLQQLIRMDRLPAAILSTIIPDESIVINDGSTGIARQICSYLESKGAVEFPAALPPSGPMGASKYDAPFMTWVRLDGKTIEESQEFPMTLLCGRGLRASTYESDYSPDGATTFYIA